MGRQTYDSSYWDGRSVFEPLRAVLDDKDHRGRKNRYIDIVQKLALSDWVEGAARVLDLGCGTGRLTGFLAGKSARVVGTDISEGMLQAARGRGEGPSFVLFDGARLPFRAGAFPEAIAVGVFQDLPDDESYLALLAETARCIEDGGRLYLLEQVSDGEDRPWRSVDRVVDACRRAGFVLERKRPVRKGRWWLLYLIRYGIVPLSLLEVAARWELRLRAKTGRPISYYMDYLFQLRKSG